MVKSKLRIVLMVLMSLLNFYFPVESFLINLHFVCCCSEVLLQFVREALKQKQGK